MLQTNAYGDVPEPARLRRPDAHELLTKSQSNPMETIKVWGAEEFELFVHEWVFSCLPGTYEKVVWAPGAGDKGRDVRAFVKEEAGEWDNFQCKRYHEPLAPNEVWLELGKLCKYTFLKPQNGGYRCPRKYYFVAQHGVGPKLCDLMENPERIREGLLRNWAEKCSVSLGVLDDGLRQYIEEFDFGVVSHVSPRRLIADMEKTSYYSWFFGLRKFVRPTQFDVPPVESDKRRYLEALYEAYAEKLSCEMRHCAEQVMACDELCEHIKMSRRCFYQADEILRSAREQLPAEMSESVVRQIQSGLRFALRGSYPDGYEKILAVEDSVGKLQLKRDQLADELEIQDRYGVCHHLAERGVCHWRTRS